MKTPRFSHRPLMVQAVVGIAALAEFAGLLTLMDAPAAQAQVAAKVESQTRPNFGILLEPPVRSRPRRDHRRYTYRDHRPDWDGPGRSHRPGGDQVVYVDCGGNPGSGAVEDAVRRVAPGGTLVIRDRGGACVGWLNIDRPMTVQGEGGYSPITGQPVPPSTLQAPDGLPCITVSAGIRVQIQGLTLASPNAGNAACVVGGGAEILISRVAFSHSGDEAAIVTNGGLLDIRDSRIDARTTSAAIVADGTALTVQNVVVSGALSGLELTPGSAAPSALNGVTFMGANTPNNFGPRAIGITVSSARELGRLNITGVQVCGYTEGVAIEGASVSIRNSRICKTDKGAVLYNGELTLADSRVRATTVGVAAASGRAIITNNVFAGMGDPFYAEDRAVIEASGNRVWSRGQNCRPSFRAAYRDRYVPYWEDRPGSGYTCQGSPYPQAWWAQEEGSMGIPYADDGAGVEYYDWFMAGYGWYDRNGRYVNDQRVRGDDRWRNIGWGQRRRR